MKEPPREPPFGGRRRAVSGEYTLELTPEREKSLVGVFRGAPVTARGVCSLHEAFYRKVSASRGGTAFTRPLSRPGTEGVFNLFRREVVYDDLL